MKVFYIITGPSCFLSQITAGASLICGMVRSQANCVGSKVKFLHFSPVAQATAILQSISMPKNI